MLTSMATAIRDIRLAALVGTRSRMAANRASIPRDGRDDLEPFRGLVALALEEDELQPGRFRVRVPFPFRAGPTIMPPGSYRVVCCAGSHGHLAIDDDGADVPVAPVTLLDGVGRSGGGGKVVFHRQGDHYVLASIWGRGAALPGAAISSLLQA